MIACHPRRWRKPALILGSLSPAETYLVLVSLDMYLPFESGGEVRWSGLIGGVELTRGQRQLVVPGSENGNLSNISFGGGNHVVMVMLTNVSQCLENVTSILSHSISYCTVYSKHAMFFFFQRFQMLTLFRNVPAKRW
jgi:hypothetical protein